MSWFFLFFFISGFCSILYEIIWLRLAMAQFGVTSALISVVISMFMAGLGLGSWGSGRWLRRYGDRAGFVALRTYALAELLIGVGAILVPVELLSGRKLIELTSLSSSAGYYFASGIWIALTLIPWCACMGATIPVAMQAIQQGHPGDAEKSFSFLYLANVLGAAAGSILPLLLIEIYGFHGTLRIGGLLNLLLAWAALMLSLQKPSEASALRSAGAPTTAPLAPAARGGRLLALLFATGLTSMGLEVVWIREFTPYLGTVVYAFASILGLYLVSTFMGSRIFRLWNRTHVNEARDDERLIWLMLGFLALLPLIAAEPQFGISRLLRLLIGVCPFSAVLGFATPMLVDRWAGGDPERAGSAYAVNVAGCIIGPLLSGFLLLPLTSERWVLCIFALPWMVIGFYPERTFKAEPTKAAKRRQRFPEALSYGVAALALLIVFRSRAYEDQYPHRVVLRDNTATVIATGEGRWKQLLINGVGITSLTPVTKMMAHLPLAFLDHPPQSALTICFGMGTTYRSLLSWGIPSTAVELAPSVPRVFGYFHSDGPELLRSPLSHLVIDDGRRYLERTKARYDVVVIDPPPPVGAAGSSMLYSQEFYAIVKEHLQPGGILQQWLPEGDAVVKASVARALSEAFPYVRLFRYGPKWGFHFLASDRPIPRRTPAQLAQSLPSEAAKDIVEWSGAKTPEQVFADITSLETPVEQFIALDPHAPAIQDDRPLNEYYVLRRTFHWK